MALKRTTQQEWLARWAERLKTATNADIQRRQTELADIRAELASATDEQHRDLLKSLIDQHESVVGSIRLSYSRWQTTAKARWGFEMPDLE